MSSFSFHRSTSVTTTRFTMSSVGSDPEYGEEEEDSADHQQEVQRVVTRRSQRPDRRKRGRAVVPEREGVQKGVVSETEERDEEPVDMEVQQSLRRRVPRADRRKRGWTVVTGREIR